ncbi:helix-turn-helix domain-containing protein [Nitrosomonas sp. ANs5]|uniref:helix-turn-helix domain-containing protein n=1 Tax=Nitrosomonas sp. ANs5 TaxID=3423941 RepID=UPI003D32DE20
MTYKQSRLLAEMQETAEGLHRSGLIDKRRMSEIQALCRLTVEPISPNDIKALRESLNVSQSVFAVLLNTSISTVQKWEIGDKHPSGPSLKLLNIVKRHGMSALA